ncbi:unnamed protein product [Darwinula stevensoni]|uniref:C-type lectin domain-containing protein n=1 Tax=Darwinula stevensoni TaxID=69355 RepID=A0A7R9A6V6_9CRUS|nr:unnamed protein product [Darwinula stevensoni]CAG0890498.1 unnamed protein product [Darwinula stevensoni]
MTLDSAESSRGRNTRAVTMHLAVLLGLFASSALAQLPCPIPPAYGRPTAQCPNDWEKVGNVCYWYPLEVRNWADAEDLCQQRGGHLLSINSAAELNTVMNRYFDDIWIGLNSLASGGSTFEWSDGSPVDFTNWNEGEPNSPEEMCTEMMHWTDNPSSHGKWLDNFCNLERRVVCKLDLGGLSLTLSYCQTLTLPRRTLDFGGRLMPMHKLSPATDTENGFRYRLTRANDFTAYGSDIQNLIFQVTYYDDRHLRFTIRDADRDRYEVPVPLNHDIQTRFDLTYAVDMGDDSIGSPFHFSIRRQDTGTVVFDTSPGGLIYEDQFLQIVTELPSEDLYGFGENGDKNVYGVHPFYEVMEDSAGNTHGVFLLNSNAMEYETQRLNGDPILTLRSIGGILDFHFFLGPSPADVSRQYTQLIGRPFLPPYWSLGFQLSRWGFRTLDDLKAAVGRTQNANIPLDIVYADIDYMIERKIFTWDPVRWAGFPEYVRELRSQGIRFVIILDPAIVFDFTNNYPPALRGQQADAFIKWYNESYIPSDQESHAGEYMVGYVWPSDKTVFPDFFKSSTKEWWKDEIRRFHEEIEFAALWIDMNEPSNFGTNEEKPHNWPEGVPPWSLKCRDRRWDNPPYKTKTIYAGENKSGTFTDKTICMTGKQIDDTNPGDVKEYLTYDTHSLYGWSQGLPTLLAAREVTGTRSMVFSRSTYPTVGQWIGHWFGDNISRWVDLHRSIIAMFEFNMFGLPYGGSDICGFLDNTTEDLCIRWMQLGAFYPFSRNHNAEGHIDQDPGMWPTVAEASRIALGARYRVLPYLYTLFYHANTVGDTVVRPLLMEFPTDVTARGIDTQFLWGSHLLLSPILTLESFNSRSAYFPQGLWYKYWSREVEFTGPLTTNLNVPDMEIPIHVRGGAILPTQVSGINTDESRQNPFGLIVALDESSQASGNLFWDDGESIDTVGTGDYFYATFSFDTVSLNGFSLCDSRRRRDENAGCFFLVT